MVFMYQRVPSRCLKSLPRSQRDVVSASSCELLKALPNSVVHVPLGAVGHVPPNDSCLAELALVRL